MFIYKITNKINGKIYIGQTIKTIEERWLGHISASKYAKNYLHRAMNKYGVDNFHIQSVVRCGSIEELNIREVAIIRIFKSLIPNGYNMMLGGQVNYMTDIVKQKIRIANTGKTGFWLNKQIPEEIKLKISNTKILKQQATGHNNPMYGKRHSEDSIKKNCLSNGSGKSFKVIKIETGETVGIWDNKAKCSRDLGIAREAVRDTLKGRVKSAKGYRLEYV
jgi:group I intron endonuclease